MAADDPGLPFEFLFKGRFDVPSWLLVIIGTVILGTYILANQMIAPWIERKVMARMQGRRGPVYVGKWGVLQIPADLFKLAIKEDTRPAGADRVGFFLAIFVTGVTSILSFAPLPWGSEGLMPANFSIGVLYVFAVFSLFPPYMLIGGWASNSKYSLIGGFRSAGQLIAYEIPMFMSVLGVLAVVGSLSLYTITEYQMVHGWFLFRYYGAGLVAGFIFFVAGVAETERIPFDIPEAEAELVMGPRTEYASWRYALLLMVEYLHLFINGLLFIYLFGGGYDPIPIPIEGSQGNNFFFWNIDVSGLTAFRTNGWVQFLTLSAKVYGIVFIAAWMRSALARLRIDQLLSLGWKRFLPVSLVTLLFFLGGPELNVFGIF